MSGYEHQYGTKTVLIFGSTGMLGHEAVDAFKREHTGYPHWYVREFSGDITNYQNVSEAIRNYSSNFGVWQEFPPDVVINCAGFTNVDDCEKNPQKAYAVNAVGPLNIARACIKYNVPLFVHISTDYVFSRGGQSNIVPTISDMRKDVDPVNQYGLSKLAGETSISNEYYTAHNTGLTDGEYRIIRTSRLYGKYRYNFVDYVCDLCLGKLAIDKKPVFLNGNISVPTSAKALADEIWNISNGIYHDSYYVEQNKKNILHCVNPFGGDAVEVPTQYGYAETIFEMLKKYRMKPNHYFEAISCDKWNAIAKKEGKAIRPYSSVLLPSSPRMFEYSRTEDGLKFAPNRWDQSLEYYIQENVLDIEEMLR